MVADRHRVVVAFNVWRALGLLLFSTYSIPGFSQTQWFKYEGNPVLDVGPPGSWDDELVGIKRVVIRDSVYQMWYTGRHGADESMGYATSRDGVTWRKHRANPVLKGSLGSWDEHSARAAYVSITGFQYQMWYAGANKPIWERDYTHIGYAVSSDGIVWTKAPNPIIRCGPAIWDASEVLHPCVLGPDAAGGYKMWYWGVDAAHHRSQIGYATGANAITWEKHSDPVLRWGTPGSWDENMVLAPRVLCTDNLYEMWFAGSKLDYSRSKIGYASSFDGIHWTKESDNPVIEVGPRDAWDDEAVFVGDVLFDGGTYYMWYVGHDGSEFRSGLAVSPKGISVSVLPSHAYLIPGSGAVRFDARVKDPSGLSFVAKIKAPFRKDYRPSVFGLGGLTEVASVRLFDDGQHGDGLMDDGLFSNSWSTTDERIYLVDLELTKRRSRDARRFGMHNTAAFTTIGPIGYEKPVFLEGQLPNPGDTVLVKLVLRNRSMSATAGAISASLSGTDSLVTDVTPSPPTYGDIAPGEVATSSAYYRLLIHPECPPDTDVRLAIAISSSGIPFWTDSFTFRVYAPWWRTWRFKLLVAAAFLGLLAFVNRRKVTRLRKEKLIQQEFSRQQIESQEAERKRLAAELHDGLGQDLMVMNNELQQFMQENMESREELKQVASLVQESIEEVREISANLHPHHLERLGLRAAIEAMVEKVSRSSGLNVRLTGDAVDRLLPKETEIHLYRIIQEALSNVVRHASAKNVYVQVKKNLGSIETTVSDDGKGFDVNDPLIRRLSRSSGEGLHGFGLSSMAERARIIGGTMKIESTPGSGTTVHVLIPYS